METLTSYLPQDRLHALVRGERLPDHTRGAAMLADVSGFTRLTETFVQELGPRLGAEALTQRLNEVYDALIAKLENFGGSVIGFSGDAITCWFEGEAPEAARRAVASGLAMLGVLPSLTQLTMGSIAPPVELSLKIGIAAGPARRFVVGSSTYHYLDVLTGATLDRMASAERQAQKGELVVAPEIGLMLGEKLEIIDWRAGFGVVAGFKEAVKAKPWPFLPKGYLAEATLKPWLLPAVYKQLSSGQGSFLAELRPAVALFLKFGDLNYDTDKQAGEKLNAYISRVQQIVAYYEGILLQVTIGDKGSFLYIAFGAPLAHENDIERAIRAGLELSQTPSEFDWLKVVQIGISYGTMRTGAYGATTRRTYGVIGDEANLAARLMQQAAPSQVLVSGRVKAVVGSKGFKWQSLGELTLRGKASSVPVYLLAGTAQSQSENSNSEISRPGLIGREPELLVLQRQLQALQKGEPGGALIIEGEAGVGKSRLIQELVEQASAAGLPILSGGGDAIELNTAYHAWRPIFEQLLGVAHLSSLSDRRQHILKLLEAESELVPLLNAVLPLNFAQNTVTNGFQEQQRAEKTRELLIKLLGKQELHPATSGLIIILEDCHWLDSASWALVQQVQQKLSGLLLVMSTRSLVEPLPVEYQKLREASGTHWLKLENLTPEETLELVYRRLKVVTLPPPVRKLLLEKAQGNPFFAEELAYAIREAGLLVIHEGQAELAPGAGELEALDFPDTVQGVITSRIDRLDPAHQLTLKVASVIGRIFPYRILEAIYPNNQAKAQLLQHLTVLEKLDITPLEIPAPETAYIFKHIITQEVTYGRLLFTQRQQLHQAIAQWYEQNYAQELTPYYPLLAYHYSRAVEGLQAELNLIEKALYYLQQAGEQARITSVNREAIQLFEQALKLLKLLPPGEERTRQELNLQLSLAKSLIAMLGWTAPRSKAALDRAQALCLELGETVQLFMTLRSLLSYSLLSGDLLAAKKLANQLWTLGEEIQEQRLQSISSYMLANLNYWSGEFRKALSYSRHSLGYYNPETLTSLRLISEDSHIVSVSCYKFATLWMLGFPQQALQGSLEALSLAQHSTSAYNLAWVYYFRLILHQGRRELDLVQQFAQELFSLANQHEFLSWRALALIYKGWSQVEQGRLEEGRTEILEGLAAQQGVGLQVMKPLNLLLLGQVQLKLGETEEALKTLDEAVIFAQSNSIGLWKGELYRLKGECLLTLGQQNEAAAEACFQSSLAINLEQEAKALELRTVISLARLWQTQGKYPESYELLTPVYSWFSEGFDTIDLKEAQNLLITTNLSQ